ncbi:MAG TPA: MBOAT family O-acyltransferase [Vicinamibacterales bacterium]
MIFTTFSYFLFLIPAALLFRATGPWFRPWVLVASGVLFFLYFSVTEFAGWMGAACIAIFIWEALLSRFYTSRSRWCLLGVAVSVGILAVFKYWNFLTGLATAGGANRWAWHGAFLPLGISFFTFEFIHYAVDRYHSRVERGTLGEYLAFIFFFPTLVAGPIKRFQYFVTGLRSPSRDWPLDWNRGITRILVGLVKKFGVADVLSSLTVHLNAADIPHASRPVLLLWLLAYAGKIYFDFSAYSDIAIGSGRLFGFAIPENFDWPYFRTNIADFWRNWHRSLTRWLTDYVFIPLGGSRAGRWRVSANVMTTMLVSGLWHGASLNFLVWGAWHGGLLVIHRWWVTRRGSRPAAPPTALGRFSSWAATFAAVTCGWAFFAMDLPTAALYFRQLIFG